MNSTFLTLPTRYYTTSLDPLPIHTMSYPTLATYAQTLTCGDAWFEIEGGVDVKLEDIFNRIKLQITRYTGQDASITWE